MLNVIMLNVIMLNVVAPIPPHCNCQDCFAKNFADVKSRFITERGKLRIGPWALTMAMVKE